MDRLDHISNLEMKFPGDGYSKRDFAEAIVSTIADLLHKDASECLKMSHTKAEAAGYERGIRHAADRLVVAAKAAYKVGAISDSDVLTGEADCLRILLPAKEPTEDAKRAAALRAQVSTLPTAESDARFSCPWRDCRNKVALEDAACPAHADCDKAYNEGFEDATKRAKEMLVKATEALQSYAAGVSHGPYKAVVTLTELRDMGKR